MKKIGTTTTGSVIVEMTSDEFKKLTMLPPDLTQKADTLAADAVREAAKRKEVTDYHYQTLLGLCGNDVTVSEMLRKIEESAPKYRLPEHRGVSPRAVRKLRDILEREKLA